MLAYTTLGVTDFERANAFYAALLSVIDAGHVMGNERIALYGTDVQNPMLAIRPLGNIRSHGASRL